MDLATHPGFKGSLSSSNCKTGPYYANRNVEVIFHVPSYIKLPPSISSRIASTKPNRNSGESNNASSPKIGRHSRAPSSASPTESAHSIHDTILSNGVDLITSSTNSPSSSLHYSSNLPTSSLPVSPNTTLNRYSNSPSHNLSNISSHGSFQGSHASKSMYAQITQDDLIYIIWIEDLRDVMTIPRKVCRGGSGLVFIFIHPLPSSAGLYWIRIVVANGAPEDHLVFGPLVDGMIISRHCLGDLVRSTAISAHLQCKYVKGNYRRA